MAGMGGKRPKVGTSESRARNRQPIRPLSMTHKNPKIKTTMTAIAAVLAFLQTELLAQGGTLRGRACNGGPGHCRSGKRTRGGGQQVNPSATIASEPLAPSAEPTPIATKSANHIDP